MWPLGSAWRVYHVNPLVPKLFHDLYRQSRCPIFGDAMHEWVQRVSACTVPRQTTLWHCMKRKISTCVEIFRAASVSRLFSCRTCLEKTRTHRFMDSERKRAENRRRGMECFSGNSRENAVRPTASITRQSSCSVSSRGSCWRQTTPSRATKYVWYVVIYAEKHARQTL